MWSLYLPLGVGSMIADGLVSKGAKKLHECTPYRYDAINHLYWRGLVLGSLLEQDKLPVLHQVFQGSFAQTKRIGIRVGFGIGYTAALLPIGLGIDYAIRSVFPRTEETKRELMDCLQNKSSK